MNGLFGRRNFFGALRKVATIGGRDEPGSMVAGGAGALTRSAGKTITRSWA